MFLCLQHLLHLLQTSWSPAILVRDTGLVPPAVHSQTRWFGSHCRQCWGGDCSVAAGAGSTRATEACMCCIVDADPGLRSSVVKWFLPITNHLMKRYNHGHFIQSLQIQFSYFCNILTLYLSRQPALRYWLVVGVESLHQQTLF